MRLLLLGAPGSGKSSLMTPLRQELGLPVLDMDEELVKLNGGAWPHLDLKRGQTRQIMTDWSEAEDVVLAYSILDAEGLALARERGWTVVLLDVPEAVLRERAARRERLEGWTNIEWLPTHLENIAWLTSQNAFGAVLDGTRPLPEVAEAVSAMARRSTPGR